MVFVRSSQMLDKWGPRGIIKHVKPYRLNVFPSAGGLMAKRRLPQQSLLTKALLEKKVLNQEVLMYQRLMDVMRGDTSFEDILKLLITSVTKGLGYDRSAIFLADFERGVGQRAIGIDRYGRFEGNCEDLPLSSVKGTHWFSDFIHGHTKAYFTNNLRRRVPLK